MNIFKLAPIDPNSPNWEASTHVGDVIIRAKSEDDARNLARSAFTIATQRNPGEDIKCCPWILITESHCEILQQSSYSEEGVAEILSPAQ